MDLETTLYNNWDDCRGQKSTLLKSVFYCYASHDCMYQVSDTEIQRCAYRDKKLLEAYQ